MIVANVALMHRERATSIAKAMALSAVSEHREGWFPIIREPFAGAWQRNMEVSVDSVLAHAAVYSCVTLIASDIAKLRIKLVELSADGIWLETTSPAFSPVLRKPNHYQTRIQFVEWWVTSRLLRGNAYILKLRDDRRIVTGMYLLDPNRVTVLVAPNGMVFYRLQTDNLAGLEDAVMVPASEIIHDRMNCLFHPLVGTSPIFACGVAAMMGNTIQRNSASFFGQGSNPGGILTAPTPIDDKTAKMLKERWEASFSGSNSGRVAVMGNNLKFEELRMSSVDSQTIEHLKWTDETVCRVFHVPAFKVGVGAMPTYSNGEILDQRYYSDCLQSPIEHMELVLDEGLGVGEGVRTEGRTLGTEFDLDGLIRMDQKTQTDTLVAGIRGAVWSTNEARHRLDLPPVPGGDDIRGQQQDFSIAALADRDRDKPFAKPDPPPPALPPGEPDDNDEEDEEEQTRAFFGTHTKALRAQLEAAA